ncbi:MAG: gamma-glutamylcyclotransferase family protein [Acidimicrobiia bacterium]
MTKNTLYFAYAALLDPDQLTTVAPNAEFRFTAHFPETRLMFVASEDSEGLPTLRPETGHTVWGAVFEIPESDVGALRDAEEGEGRVADWDIKAVDREGNKYECLTFVSKNAPNGELRPDSNHLEAMIKGAKHWSLPAGWVLGLKDLGDDSPF